MTLKFPLSQTKQLLQMQCITDWCTTSAQLAKRSFQLSIHDLDVSDIPEEPPLEILPWLPSKVSSVASENNRRHGFTDDQLISQLRQRETDYREALQTFKAASTHKNFDPDYRVYELMIKILGHSRKFKAMELFLDRVKQKSFKCRTDLLIHVIRVYGEAGFLQKAVSTFFAFHTFGCKYNSKLLNTLLKILIAADSLEMAVKVLRDINNHLAPLKSRATVSSYNLIIREYCKRNRLDKALQMIEFMKFQGCSPDVTTYGILIKGLCDKGKAEESLEVFNRLRNEGTCVPDLVIFNTILHGFCKIGKFSRISGIVSEMKRYGCRPDVVTYNTLVFAACQKGNVQKAFSLLRAMPEKGIMPDFISFYTLMNFLCKKREVQQCRELFEEMLENDIKPDFSCYSLLIKALCKEQMAEQAIEMLHRMFYDGFAWDFGIYKALVGSLCMKGMLGVERQIVAEALKKGLLKSYEDEKWFLKLP